MTPGHGVAPDPPEEPPETASRFVVSRGRHRLETPQGTYRKFDAGDEIPESLARANWDRIKGRVAYFSAGGNPDEDALAEQPDLYQTEALASWYASSDLPGDDPAKVDHLAPGESGIADRVYEHLAREQSRE